MKKQICLMLTVALMASCQQSGEVVVHNEGGRVIEKYHVNKDSLRQGLYEAYFESGNLKEKATYKDGKLNGERTLFFTNGQAEITEQYISGVMNGDYKVFYESGQLKLVQNYVDGQLTGTSVKYHENGEVAERVNFIDGEENGPFEEYHPNGEIQWRGNYLNGDNEVGLLEEFDTAGVVIKKMMCDSQAICRTIWTVEDGDITPKY